MCLLKIYLRKYIIKTVKEIKQTEVKTMSKAQGDGFRTWTDVEMNKRVSEHNRKWNELIKPYYDFLVSKLKPGDLVEVPRTQFSEQRRGWNGWLFSEAVVISKGIGNKSKKPVVKVLMRMPGKRGEYGVNDYGECEKIFFAEHVFQTNAVRNAERFMKADGVETKEAFYQFIKEEDVTGCDWIKFLVDKGFLFGEESGAAEGQQV